MSGFFWYESTPTIIDDGETTTYLNCDERHWPKDAEGQEYVRKSKVEGGPVVVVKRKHVAVLLEDVPAAEVATSGIDPETLDVSTQEKASKTAPESDVEKAKVLAEEHGKKGSA